MLSGQELIFHRVPFRFLQIKLQLLISRQCFVTNLKMYTFMHLNEGEDWTLTCDRDGNFQIVFRPHVKSIISDVATFEDLAWELII